MSASAHGGADPQAGGRAELSPLERDALTELVNIGVSRAAASLRKMVGGEVLLSVPAIEIIPNAIAAALIGEREGEDLVAVRQDFAGAFRGRALLIFPQSNGLELVRAVLGDGIAPEEAAEMEREALAETGNIILNGCLATMANMLHRSLTMSLPGCCAGTGGRCCGPRTGMPRRRGWCCSSTSTSRSATGASAATSPW